MLNSAAFLSPSKTKRNAHVSSRKLIWLILFLSLCLLVYDFCALWFCIFIKFHHVVCLLMFCLKFILLLFFFSFFFAKNPQRKGVKESKRKCMRSSKLYCVEWKSQVLRKILSRFQIHFDKNVGILNKKLHFLWANLQTNRFFSWCVSARRLPFFRFNVFRRVLFCCWYFWICVQM